MTQARDLADGKFDTDTLVVDATNNRVGVGTTSPADHLAVVTSGANAQLSVDRSDGATGRTVLIHSSSGGQLQTTGSAPLIFGTADTERGRFLAAGGLTFNGDTASANALNDYEEGTFTITMTSGSGSITINTSEDTGLYTKIGRMVLVSGRCKASSVSSPSDEFRIGGFPFNTSSASGEQSGSFAGGIFVWNGTQTNNGLWTLFGDKGANSAVARWGNSATPGSSANYIQSGTEIRFSITYHTDS